MAQTARYYRPDGSEVVELGLIWADRVAIAAWLLTGGLIGLIYALWGDPDTFITVEQLAGAFTLVVWFVGRVLDFTVTGRIRYGTV